MKTIYILLLSFILMSYARAFGQDTLYFDKDWNETTKANHLYYRLLPLKEMQDIYYIQDFHKNGNMQMQGYVLKNNPEQFVGDVYWYDENGYDSGKSQYINSTADKVLTYYHDDGKLWQKISYNEEGKKGEIKVYLNDKEITSGKIKDDFHLIGNFSHDKIETFYISLKHNSTIEESDSLTDSSWDNDNPYIASSSDTENKKKEKYFITTYWKNGQKASELEMVYQNEFNAEKGLLTFWDESGKLLSQVNYADENYYNKHHIKYTYYTKNGIAYSLAKQETYVGLYLDGESLFYANDGALTQKLFYASGALTKEDFFENNKLTKTNLYLEGNPFDGNFRVNKGQFTQEFTLHKGQKVGKETWQKKEDGSYFSSGEYKNNKPWSGTFVKETDENFIITLQHYKDGILDGTQQKYKSNYNIELIETYEMRNGLREGIRKIYVGENKILESVYQNDKIWEGQIYDDNQLLSYEKGVLKHKKIGSSPDEQIMNDEEFYQQDGKIEKVIYRSFQIEENPKPYYEGIYKDGKPYNGYFQIDTLIDNIHLVDYYENGELKYKYSFDLLKEVEGFGINTYTLKSIYLNNKIVEGPTYQLVGKSVLLETVYKNSEPVLFKMNLFGMHYYNQYTFTLEQEKIKISDLESKKWLEISKENSTFIASIWENGKRVNSSPKNIETNIGGPNTLVFYYLKENKINSYSKIFVNNGNDDRSLINQLFYVFPLFSADEISQLFNKMLKSYQLEEPQEDYFTKAFEEYTPFPDESFLSVVEYDEQGKIPYGIRITEKKDHIVVEGIYNNEIKKTFTFNNIAELLKNDKAILKKLEKELLNDY